MKYYEDMWRYTVEVFRNMDVPVRQLECCSGDLADLKVNLVTSKHGVQDNKNTLKSVLALL